MTTTETTTPKTNGHAKNGATSAPAILMLPLKQISESPSNPRKTFTDMEDLAKSVAGVGLLQPILVRPKGKAFEIIFGHRRYRASKTAGLAEVPCMVRDVDDQTALEMMLIENSARSDIHPLEEAEGYEALHTKYKYTVEQIASKTSKSVATIYARLKLCALVPEARKAYHEGKLSASTALYVARVPAQLQKEALTVVVDWDGTPISAREAQEEIQHRFMLRLSEAPFDRGDVALVPAAGACTTCPHRTGNQKELFPDVKSADTCTNPPCFESKKEAHGKRVLEEAKAKGATVLEGKKADDAVGYGSAFVKLDTRCFDDKKERTYRELSKGAEVPLVVARTKAGEIVELAPKKELAKVLRKAGVRDQDVVERKASSSYGDDEKRRRRAAQGKRAATLAILGAIVAAAIKKVPGTNFWPFLAGLLIENCGHDEGMEILKRRGSPPDKKRGCYEYRAELRKLLGSLKPDGARGLAVELLVAGIPGAVSFSPYGGTDVSKHVLEAARFYGVNAAKIGAAARAELAKKKTTAKAAALTSPKTKKTSKKKGAK